MKLNLRSIKYHANSIGYYWAFYLIPLFLVMVFLLTDAYIGTPWRTNNQSKMLYFVPVILKTCFAIVPIVFFGLFTHIFLVKYVEKHLQIHASLPVSRTRISLSRSITGIPYFLIYALVELLLFGLFYLSIYLLFFPRFVVEEMHDIDFQLILKTSMFLLIYVNLLNAMLERSLRFTGYIILIVLAGQTVPREIGGYWFSAFADFALSPIGAILISALLMSLVYFSYSKKRSYLE